MMMDTTNTAGILINFHKDPVGFFFVSANKQEKKIY